MSSQSTILKVVRISKSEDIVISSLMATSVKTVYTVVANCVGQCLIHFACCCCILLFRRGCHLSRRSLSVALDSGCRFPVTLTTTTFSNDEVLVGDTLGSLQIQCNNGATLLRSQAFSSGLRWPATASLVSSKVARTLQQTVLSERPSSVYYTKYGMWTDVPQNILTTCMSDWITIHLGGEQL